MLSSKLFTASPKTLSTINSFRRQFRPQQVASLAGDFVGGRKTLKTSFLSGEPTPRAFL
jgi:hypothetical protein